jgi:hypothetical protein
LSEFAPWKNWEAEKLIAPCRSNDHPAGFALQGASGEILPALIKVVW